MTQAYNLSQFANFLNSSGQVSAAGLQAGVTLASGTVSLFYQSAAPTGWTQVTSLNDYALRLVSSSGGTTGGTTAFSTVFANQTVSGSGTIGATTLTTTQMPSHTHGVDYYANNGPTPAVGSANTQSLNGTQDTSSVGGGASHTHSFTGVGSTITLNVRYANIILCSKN
jgi:hypothetical protein